MSEDNGDEKRKLRGDALRGRLSRTSETSEASETSETSETEQGESADEADSSEASETSETTETSEASEESESGGLRGDEEKTNVNMYLPTKLVNLMGVTFDEVNRPYKLEGTPLQKNRHYRPLVLRLGLEALEEMDDDEIRDRLEDDDLLDDPPE